jgi:hypothetical protein
MNINIIKKSAFFIVGVVLIILGAYFWYQSGLNFPQRVDMDWSGDTITVPSIFLIAIGLAMVCYGYFIRP